MSSAQKEALSPACASGGAASPKACDTADHFEKLSGIDKSFVLSVFSVGSPRLVEKGKKLAREGHLSESLAIHEADGTVVLRTKCWASQKKRQYKIFIALAVPELPGQKYQLLDFSCSCPAGKEKCVHLSALLHYVRAKAAFWRTLKEEEEIAGCRHCRVSLR